MLYNITSCTTTYTPIILSETTARVYGHLSSLFTFTTLLVQPEPGGAILDEFMTIVMTSGRFVFVFAFLLTVDGMGLGISSFGSGEMLGFGYWFGGLFF